MEKRVVRRHTHAGKAQRSKVRHFHIGEGLPSLQDLRDELEDMRAVLLGHVDPPIQEGISTLMEVAEGYFSRACDIEQQILRGIHEGTIPKTSGFNNPFRTQELRSFKDMSKSASELGSRRISAADLRFKQETFGRETGR